MKDRFIFAAALFWGTIAPQPIPLVGVIDSASYNGMVKLRFSTKGSFKISVFEDLHFGEGSDNRRSPSRTSVCLEANAE